MAVPKGRTSKTRARKRRTHYKLNVPKLVTCPRCGSLKMPHRPCLECGYYKYRKVVETKAE